VIISLVLAAGRGERFSKERRKQFECINGVPVFVHAILPYLDPAISAQVVLAVNADRIDWADEQLAKHGIQDSVKLTAGGNSRQESINAAYRFAANKWPLSATDAVLLHNAASPNVSVETIRKCLEGLRQADMVQPYTPQVRTQILLDTNGVAGVPDRSSFGVNCDPTAYRADALKRVIEHMAVNGLSGDSTIDLAFSLGLNIGAVIDDASNIKITTPWDLAAISAAMDKHSAEGNSKNSLGASSGDKPQP